ncbi:hypothetical protein B566_EDAN003853 [Ephemera danica]|nr:hypothetical protein B566_EDAN003853 [Ephemera danica]
MAIKIIMKYVKTFYFLVVALCFGFDRFKVLTQANDKKTSALELVIESPLFLISTLDGSLIAVDQQTGDIKWKLVNEPVVKVPIDEGRSISPLFLPDPKDGSLYVLGGPSGYDALKKLPFTIPQLVASSPCRSSDGILYTGRKVDSWMSVDADSGKKHQVLSFDSGEIQVCPADGTRTIFIGRTEYNVMMFDSVKKHRKWNVTFYDYNAITMEGESLTNYAYTHFATNALGRVVTLNRNSGKILWQQEFESPAVAMYQVQGEVLVSVPFTSVGIDTLESMQSSNSGVDTKLSPTLYIGQHHHGLYALPSLVDNSITATISHPQQPLLIEGPKNKSEDLKSHYQVPELIQTRLHITEKIAPALPGPEGLQIEPVGSSSIKMEASKFDTPELLAMWQHLSAGNISALFSVKGAWNLAVRRIQELTSNQLSTGSRGSHGSSSLSELEDQFDGDSQVVRVGKIELFPDQVLGRGCEGTFVFHGRFEGRPVAVKRLLPECFTVADREVDLLRESDEHPNVIRYFCTEKDRQFRYIALELCAATLEDYVQGRFGQEQIKEVDVLSQATSGLAHLHSLDIVHRDIKPHNVLLSHANNYGEVKAMISDFGLCKKLQRGRHSFSHRSGVAGTDGWIAPEMINPNVSATCSVDIFSMGCVFYYVLSKGKHPFGDNLRRQANILSGEYNLDDLQGHKNALQCNLVEAMIASNPSERPPASAIIKHPFFWDATRNLTFFQDVSDRVESEEQTNEVLLTLEKDGWAVVRRDWRKHVGEEVAADLRKYRNYRGHSVRDLLRALRNKKHHYRDLSEEARQSLGEPPTDFLQYWTARFPLLLVHSWLAMQCVKHEKGLNVYYPPNFVFPKNYKATLSASDSQIPEPEESTNSTPSSSKNHDGKKYSKYRKKPNIADPIWLTNWREPAQSTQHTNDGGDAVEEKNDAEMKDWSRAWPEGSNRKAQVRIRKKPTQDPVWMINWRDPSQTKPGSSL